MADEEKKRSVSDIVREKTVCFTFCKAELCEPFSNIRKINECEITKIQNQLKDEGWNGSYSIVAIELVPKDADAADKYPTPLHELSAMSDEKVSS